MKRFVSIALRLGSIALLWGSEWIANERIGASLGALQVVAGRYAIAGVCLGLMCLLPSRQGRLPAADVWRSVGMGFTLFVLPTGLLIFGSGRGAGSLAALMFAMLPLGLALAAGTLRAAPLVSVAAMVILLNGSWPASSRALVWAAPAALAVVLQGRSLIVLKREPGLRTVRSLTVQCGTAAVVFGIVGRGAAQFQSARLGAWLAVAALGVLGTALAYWLLYGLLGALEPAEVAMASLLQVPFGLLEIAWQFRVRPTPQMLGATACLLLATAAMLKCDAGGAAPPSLLHTPEP